MLRVVANLDVLFSDRPLQDRFAAARDAGFTRIEMSSPYDMTIRDLDRALTQNHLELSLICSPLGDRAAGEFGFMGVPRRIADFRNGFQMALAYADALEVDVIHLMAGNADISRAQKMLKRNLAWAAYHAPNKILTLGPVHSGDATGYAITGFDHALELIDWIGAPNLGLHFDAGFAHESVGDIAGAWAKYGARACHLEMASAAFDETPLLAALQKEGFHGIVSAQRAPSAGL
ncbi:MAG: TIM barrel protein [Pseudomonadota bacterium]